MSLRKQIQVIYPGICGVNSSLEYWKINDIAIVELDEDVPFSDFIQPALIGNFDLSIGTKLRLVGYGADPVDDSVGILKSGWIRGIYQCFLAGKRLSIKEWFCAESYLGEQKGCPGDSGAGAMYHSNDRWYIVGVYVRGSDCKPSEQGGSDFVAIRKHAGDICKYTDVCPE